MQLRCRCAALRLDNAVGDVQVKGVGAGPAAIADHEHVLPRLRLVQHGGQANQGRTGRGVPICT